MENVNHLNAVQRFFLMLKAYKKEVSLTYLYAIFGGLVNLILPLAIQSTLNLVQAGNITASWWFLVIVVGLGTVFNGALVIMQSALNENFQKRIFTDISFDFATRIPQIDLEQVRNEHLPEIVNRFFETVTLTKGIPKILTDLTTALLQIIFGLLLLSFYHPYFIVFGLVLILYLFIIFRFTGSSGLKTSIQESKYKYEVVYWLEELARSVFTFKHASGSDFNLKKTDGLVSEYLKAKDKHFSILITQYWALVSFKTLVTLVLLVLGGSLVVRNQISVGQFVAAEIVIILIINASEKMILLMDVIYDVLTSLDKVGHVMDLGLEKSGNYAFPLKQGISFSLNDVSFSFKNTPYIVLENINLAAAPFERVCIAGYNASGRTTLMQLIGTFLKPTKGSIAYNNLPLENFQLSVLRQEVGYFSSREQIFKGTLKENITLGFDDISTETVVNLLETVGLTEFLSELPKGIDSLLLPNGKNLSKSISAKIIIARALAHQPHLLVIEDLLQSLQPSDRIKIIDLITSPERNWTLVCASNDPYFASHCDSVVILQEGKIVEMGSFDEIRSTTHFSHVFKTETTNTPFQNQ